MKALNIGAGRATFPTTRDNPFTDHLNFAIENGCPAAYDTSIEWINIDRIQAGNIDDIVNVFRYPWLKESDHKPFEDDTFDIIWCSHIVEHIPHEIKLSDYGGGRGGIEQHLKFFHRDGDGWFSWFYEVWRIMKPNAMLYILAPYGHSIGALSDPTHTRFIMPGSFGYFAPNDDAPFDYDLPMHFEMALNPQTSEPVPGIFKVTNETSEMRDRLQEMRKRWEVLPMGEEKTKLGEAVEVLGGYIERYMIRHFAQIAELFFSFKAIK